MVNPIYTEPDPDNDLDPDIRNYSHHQHNQLHRDRSPGSAQASSPTQHQQVVYSSSESNALQFVSEKPLDTATTNADSQHGFNEKDYATGGYGYPTATTIGSQSETTAAGTTLNPSPHGLHDLDRQTSVSTTRSSVHPDDEEPAFPFISWKQSAIVGSYLTALPHNHHLVLTLPEHRQGMPDHLRSTDPAAHRLGIGQHRTV